MPPPLLVPERDFAEITTGAQVVMSLTSYSIAVEPVPWYGHYILSLCSGRDFDGSRQLTSAQLVFKERDERDGTCWMFAGKYGSIAVRLADPTIPTSIAIHQPVSHQLTARTGAQAPRHIVLWGLTPPEQDQNLSPNHPDTSSQRDQGTFIPETTTVDHFASSRRLPDLPRSVRRDTRLDKIGEFEQAKNTFCAK
ncbi:hypothetical protein BDZ89DRAFT_1034231 [Hymenopellis radicata]|nr:hypothetical protein BDZ89DRAFT_1034231 [Hymenopellis radicata]